MADIFDLFKRISTKKDEGAKIEYIVAGLGNPGTEYAGTRHNAGYMTLDYIAEKLGVEIISEKQGALTARAEIGGHGLLLVKPLTYMNLSGNAIGPLANFYKIPPEKVIVVCDDVNFDTGFMRIRRKGSAGGHNGLKDIIAKLGSEDFIRIRLGVGKKPTPEYDMADWVLGKLNTEQMQNLSSCFEKTYGAITDIICSDVDTAMRKYSK